MIKRRKFPKIFFGWWTVLAGGLLSLWGHGYYTYGFSALFKPIASEFGFSRAVTSVVAGIGRLEGGFGAPLAGWMTDRFGPRWIVFLGVFLFALALILMNFIDSLWAFYMVWGLTLGMGFDMSLSLPLDKAITNWFVKKRGLALSIKMLFSGLSGVLVLPFIAWLIATQGWRMTCLTGGLVMGFIGLPLAWLCLKQRRPEYYGLLPDGAIVRGEATEASQMIDEGVEYAAEVEEVEFTLRQAMRTPAYWLLILACGAHFLVSPAINTHCIPFLTDIGIDPLKAAGMMAIMVLASIPARPLSGLLADRVRISHLRFLLGGILFLEAAGIAVFLLNQTTIMIYVWFIIYGVGTGAAYTVMSPIRARYFGRKAFGSISGSSAMFMAPLGVVVPIYTGWVYDTTGNYIPAFTLFAVLLACCAVLACFIPSPKPPAKVTDIRKIV